MPSAIISRVNRLKKIRDDRRKDRPIKLDLGWKPIPDSPQEQAFKSEADEIFYGGSAGGGKTYLLIGLALTSHQESIIFRREYPQLKEIIAKAKKMCGKSGKYNSQEKMLTLIDGRTLELGAAQYEDDWEKYQGRPHDLVGFDEITHFTQTLYQNLIGWNRTTIVGQRCRVVCTGNPPVTPEGQWVRDYWGPWLKPDYPNPAKPGEIRWFATVGDNQIEVENGTPFEHEGETIYPRSRTFIPALLSDNPYLDKTGYRSVLQSLPEPLRSRLLYGDFGLEAEDSLNQVFPSAWIDAAQSRWMEQPPEESRLSAIGIDPARGGKDETVICRRFADWFDFQAHPGKSTPDGPSVAQLVVPLCLNSDTDVNVDVIGIGSSVVDSLHQLNIPATALCGSAASTETDRSGKLGFVNQRSQWIWQFREMLDPDYGSQVAIPPDPKLKADLCAIRWLLRGWKIAIEAKDDIKKRIGRSPDRGESIIYASVARGAIEFDSVGPRESSNLFEGY